MENSDFTIQNNDAEAEISLFELCRSVFKKIWLLLLVAAVASGLTFFVVTITEEDLYDSSYKSYLYADKTLFSSADAHSIIQMYDYIATNENILQRVIDDSGIDLSISQVEKMLSFKLDDKNTIVTVTVSAEDPAAVSSIAESLNKVVSAEIKAKVKGIQVETLVSPSQPMLNSSVNQPFTSAVMIGLLFFILTAVIVIIVEIAEDKVKGAAQLEERCGFVVLGTVPECGKHSVRRL